MPRRLAVCPFRAAPRPTCRPMNLSAAQRQALSWVGIAVLAAYVKHREKTGETLAEFLDNKVFSQAAVKTMQPDPADTAGFETYIKRFRKGLELEREAVRLFIDTEE